MGGQQAPEERLAGHPPHLLLRRSGEANGNGPRRSAGAARRRGLAGLCQRDPLLDGGASLRGPDPVRLNGAVRDNIARHNVAPVEEGRVDVSGGRLRRRTRRAPWQRQRCLAIVSAVSAENTRNAPARRRTPSLLRSLCTVSFLLCIRGEAWMCRCGAPAAWRQRRWQRC